MNNAGTSTPEQSIFYYVQRFFPDAQNRYQFQTRNSRFEIDIYISSIKVAIEYDGAFWHKDKDNRDLSKNVALNKEGIYVIRIRDLGCPELPDFYGKIFYHGKSPDGHHTNECIELAVHELAQFCTDKNLAVKLLNFKLTFDDYVRDLPDITACFFPNEVADNKSQFCGAELWDEQSNGRLSLKNIPADDTSAIFVNLVCKAGKKIHIDIRHLQDKRKCKTTCDKCFGNICLFMAQCDESCPIIYNYILDYLDGKVSTLLLKDNIYYAIYHSSWLIELFKKRFACNNSDWNKRFDDLRISLTDSGAIKDIDDFKFAKEYLEKCGGIIKFDLLTFDQSGAPINAVADYFSAIYDKLVNLKQNDPRFTYFGQYYTSIRFFYCQWERNKSQMSDELKSIVIDFIKRLEEKVVNTPDLRHKFEQNPI